MSINIAIHSGKLAGIRSISTSVGENKICQKRQLVKGSVCKSCYARRIEAFRKPLRLKLHENTEILSKRLAEKNIPRFNDAYFRIESFGDCASVTQAKNYIRIAYANPGTRFAVWTKNLRFYKEAFDKIGKPKNIVLVYSSPIIGEVGKIEDEFRDIVDHRFTVMPRGTDKKKITCGGRKCLECLRCYRKNTQFDVFEIVK